MNGRFVYVVEKMGFLETKSLPKKRAHHLDPPKSSFRDQVHLLDRRRRAKINSLPALRKALDPDSHRQAPQWSRNLRLLNRRQGHFVDGRKGLRAWGPCQYQNHNATLGAS